MELTTLQLLKLVEESRLLSTKPNDGGCLPVTFNLRSEKEHQKLVVITGLNATGKSLLRRLIGTYFRRNNKDAEVMHLSLEKRTEGGIVSALMFGSESDRSTGSITAHSISTGIRTSRQREKDHLLFWDEPDLGLSDEYLADAAKQITEHSQETNHCQLIGFNTHRRDLIRLLLKSLGDRIPHHIHMGDFSGPTLQQWVDREIIPRSLAEIEERNHQTFRKIIKATTKP